MNGGSQKLDIRVGFGTIGLARQRQPVLGFLNLSNVAIKRDQACRHGLCVIVGQLGVRNAVPARQYIFFGGGDRSEEHTSELQSLMRNSYAVFCLNTTIYK